MAQHPSFWVLNHEQGLPSLKVYDLMEDSLGVMWIGTSEGLVHYDGLWLNTLKCEGSLAPDRSMMNQAAGVVWSMNFAGQLFCSDYERMWRDTVVSKHFTGRILDIQTESDRMLFLTSAEIVELQFSDGSITVKHRLTDNKFYSAAGDRYANTSKGLVDLGNGAVIVPPDGPTANICVSPGSDFRAYHTTGKVSKLNDGKETVVIENLRTVSGSIPRINAVRTTSAGTWITTYEGVYLVEQNKWLFPNEPISDVEEAKDGSTWFSTLTDGIRVVPNLELKRFAKNPDGLPTERFNRVRQLPNGNMVASDNSGTVVIIHPEKGLISTFIAEIAAESEALEVDTANGRILAAFGSLYLLDLNLKLLDKLPGNFKSISFNERSLNLINGSKLNTVSYDGNKFGELDGPTQPDNQVSFQVFTDALNRNWWIHSESVNVDGKTLSLERKIRMGTSSPSGVVFLSDRKGSIAVVDGSSTKWLVIPSGMRADGTVRGLAAYEDQLVVMLSNGLLHYSASDETWKRYGISEGLPPTDLRDVIFANEKVWLASFNGLYEFPMEQHSNMLPPAVSLRQLNVNGQAHSSTQNLNFEYNENDLELVLRGISTRSRGRIQFRYRLSGLMDDFELNPNGNILRFRALPPGNYDLQVFAIDANGIQSERPFELSFSIAKPWYATWPFYLSVALLLVLIVSVIFLFRIRYINQRNTRQLENSRLKEDLRASQLTALRAQMNPHFMFNVLNSVQGLFTLGKTEKANEVLSRFSDLMRSVLDVSDQNTIGLDRELELIGLYLELEAVRFGANFEYRIDVDSKIDPTKLTVPSLLIQPYVENAVKHGLLHRKGKKELHVSLTLSNDGNALDVRIDDNGVGREMSAQLRSQKHRSFATEASSSRLNLLNVESEQKIGVRITDKKDENGNALGTLVELRVPLRQMD